MNIWKKIKKILFMIGWPWWRLIKFSFRISFKWRWGFGLGSIALLAMSLFVTWFYFEVLASLPNINLIYNPPKLTTIITDRNGVLLYKFYDGENRTWVKFNEIPKSMIEATIAIEDKDFYNHKGVSISGVTKAAWYNLKNGDEKMRGGSTITQQLIKNVFLSNEKTVTRKMKEMMLAFFAESKMSKNEILERYLNQVPFGGEVYGVSEAAQKYYGKKVSEINLAEGSMLAGLIAAPSSYSPTNGSFEYAKMRQKHVLEEMVSMGVVSEKEAQAALNQKIEINNQNLPLTSPHFVFYVKDYLREKFGFDNFMIRGLKITTTLDENVQKMVEQMVESEVDKSKKLGFSNGAALVTNPSNGEILSMVGSKNYWAKDIDGKFNVTTAQRQPGSSIKPINYLLAFQKGKTPFSIIDDSPITYNIAGQKPYAPKNYTGKYMGRVTLRTALGSSLNTPSVKLLAENGVDNMINLAESMGITTWGDRKRYGLSLALGGGEVKMTEMATAYGVFANLGQRVDINPILEIKNYLGETIYKNEVKKQQIVESEYAFLINDILSDNEARTPIFGAGSKLRIAGKTAAVKTGTTNNLKDNWCIGWTPSLLVATWVGNNDSSPMSWVASGVSGATPIWNNIMTNLLKDKKDEKWEKPDKIVYTDVCGKKGFSVKNTIPTECIPSPTPTPTP